MRFNVKSIDIQPGVIAFVIGMFATIVVYAMASVPIIGVPLLTILVHVFGWFITKVKNINKIGK